MNNYKPYHIDINELILDASDKIEQFLVSKEEKIIIVQSKIDLNYKDYYRTKMMKTIVDEKVYIVNKTL